jgi:hypothetical protein
VPHGAFQKERELRKGYQNEDEELKNQLAEAKRNQLSEETEETEEESEITKLRREIKEIKDKQRDDEITAEKLQLESNVNIVHKNLLEKGIDGFDTVGRYMVDSILRSMYMEDPDFALAHDNPEGWEKIYMETMPHLQKIGREQHKTEIIDKKKEAKKEAALVTTVGKETDDETTPTKKKLTPEQAYIQEREQNKV